MQRMLQTSPATSLDDAYKTLSTRPLIDPDEFGAFYRGEVNAVRGGDVVARMVLSLNRSYGGSPFKTFLMGHPGVGKSTEMTRLCHKISDKYRVIRFSAQTDLNATGFQPFDVLLEMMIKLAEEIGKPVAEGGAGKKPSNRLIEAIAGWFATEKRTLTQDTNTNVSGSAGLKPSPISWAKLLGLFVEIKGEIKYTADRKLEVTEYRLSTIASLIDLLNRLLDECNRLLKQHAQREWLFIGEDFDKPGIPPPLIETLFINYANIFHELRTHLIFNIPVALAYSEKASQLPLPLACIPDTPVFLPDHTPHEKGRAALRITLEARLSPELFEEGQMMRLIVASGGNLRDLFEMVGRAADNAALRTNGNGKINAADVADAINEKRSDYVRRLGTSPFDEQTLTYDEKADLLVKIGVVA